MFLSLSSNSLWQRKKKDVAVTVSGSTTKMPTVKAIPAEAWHGKYGLYLSLPYSGEPEEKIKKMMIWHPSRYGVCLLNGDESGVYWKMRVFDDYTLLVMDDDGNYLIKWI